MSWGKLRENVGQLGQMGKITMAATHILEYQKLPIFASICQFFYDFWV